MPANRRRVSGVSATPTAPAGKAPRAEKPPSRAGVPLKNDGLSPRERRRNQRISMGHEQILDVAEELFGNNGYAATSLEQVAAGSEFSVGAVYTFVGSKQELLVAVLDRRSAAHAAAVQASLDAGGTGADQLLRLAKAIIEFFRAYPAYGRLVTRIWSENMETLPDIPGLVEAFATAMRTYETVIAQGQRDGSLRAGSPAGLGRLVSSLVTAHHLMDPELYADVPGMTEDDILEIIGNALRPVAS